MGSFASSHQAFSATKFRLSPPFTSCEYALSRYDVAMVKLSEGWKRWLNLRLLLCLIATAAVVLAFYLENWFWHLGLLTHFHAQFLVLLGILALTAFFFRAWKMGLCFLVLVSICAYPVWPLFFYTEHHTTELDFTVASINVHTANPEKEKLLRLLQDRQPDLVLLMEVDAAWMKALEPLRETYPHVITKPRGDNFGIALLSRYPFQHTEFKYWGEAEVPSILAEFFVLGRAVCFIGTHPVPPVSAEGTRLRDGQIREVLDYVKSIPESVHVILAGDFNTTPFSRSFCNAIDVAGLYNSANGFGLQPTWPRSSPLFRIPIDHIFLSPNLNVAFFEVEDDIGSDHYPIMVGLGFAIR